MSEPDSTQPLRPEVLDPYPVRPHSAEGVRWATDSLAELRSDDAYLPLPELDPAPFAASLKPGQRAVRSGRPPWEAIALACLAQVMLGAAMATNLIPAIVGALMSVTLLLCCLALIAAQVMTDTDGS